MNGRKGWVHSWAAVVVLAVVAGPGFAQKNDVLAIVNGEPIRAAEVEEILKKVPPSPTPLTAAQRKQGRRDVVEHLINDALMRQFLQRELRGQPALKPNSPEVTKRLRELTTALKAKGQTLAQFLKEGGMTEKELRSNTMKALQWEAFLKARVHEADLQRYYQQYQPYFDKVLVRASHILVRLPANARDIDRTVTRNKLRSLRQQILSGKITFADAAKKYSDCPSGKKEGGDLGFFQRRFDVLEPFAQAAFALKVGDLSDVVETEWGMHLIKVVARTPGKPSTFEKVKDQVRMAYSLELNHSILESEYRKAKIKVNLP